MSGALGRARACCSARAACRRARRRTATPGWSGSPASAGVTALVDAAGPAVAAALAAAPDLVTPNLAEAEAALGHGDGAEPVDVPPDARPRAEAAAAALCARGARAAVVTAAAAGAALATGAGDTTWLPAPAVAVRNPIGAGDALLAGLAAALERGEPLDRAARAGMAAAGAAWRTSARAGSTAARAAARCWSCCRDAAARPRRRDDLVQGGGLRRGGRGARPRPRARRRGGASRPARRPTRARCSPPPSRPPRPRWPGRPAVRWRASASRAWARPACCSTAPASRSAR